MPAVQNRAIPTGPNSDEGYVITIVPKRRDMLVHAKSKGCDGCYIRSGDGFHALHPAIIAEFYSRRPSPILYLELQLAEPSQAKFSEKMIELHDVNQQGRGTGTFKQHVAVEWNAILRNSGRGSANHVVLDLRVPESSTCSIVSSDFEVKEYFYSSTNIVPVLMPLPTARFVDGTSGRIHEPIHPGQEVRVAFGELRIPFEAFETEIVDFEVSGFAYAADAPYFPLTYCKSGTELKGRYSDVFHALRKKAPPATRETLEPGRRIIRTRKKGPEVVPDQP